MKRDQSVLIMVKSCASSTRDRVHGGAYRTSGGLVEARLFLSGAFLFWIQRLVVSMRLGSWWSWDPIRGIRDSAGVYSRSTRNLATMGRGRSGSMADLYLGRDLFGVRHYRKREKGTTLCLSKILSFLSMSSVPSSSGMDLVEGLTHRWNSARALDQGRTKKKE